MSADWPLKKISDVCEFLNSKRVPLKSLDRDKRQGKYPYYGASGVVDHIDGYIFDGTHLLISEDGENLRSRKTPIAFKASGKFWVNNHAHILAEKEDGILDYLEYYFSKLDLTPYITGAVQPKLNKANLDTIEIPIPPPSERLFINKVLNAFTEKIELNRQTNQTLENIAQAIFKSWFVDFEPTRAKIAAKQNGQDPERAAMASISGKSMDELDHLNPEQQKSLKSTAALFPDTLTDSELGEIPEGWEVEPLSSFGNIVCGKTPSKKKTEYYGGGIPFIKIPDMHGNMYVIKTTDSLSAEGANTQAKKLLPIGSVCVSCIATVGQVVISSEDSFTNQQINSIVPKDKYCTPYLYFTMLDLYDQLHDLASGGSATLNLNTGNFSKIIIIKPSDGVLKGFSQLVEPIMNTILANYHQQEALSSIRDTLLPKLLSGELETTEIEMAVANG